MSQPGRILLDAAVQQLDENSVRICWETACDADVWVYAGPHPDAIDRSAPVARSKDGCVELHGLNFRQRHYFGLEAGGHRLITAARRVQLDGTVNFRDMGGYATADGRRVKWGRAFRADGLSRLTDRDLDFLVWMGIRRVYDFRTASEMAEAPDRLPEGGQIGHIHLPVTHGNFDFAEAVRLLQKGDNAWLTPDFMINGYIGNLEQFAHCWAAVIRDLAESRNGPLVFHCTGGKDRTGTCAALILLALGVAEETVIDDHQLSNIYIADLLPRLYRRMERAGIDPDRLFPYLTAPRHCIVAVIDYLMDTYGTAADYLVEKAGLQPAVIDQMRENLLE
ncbi:MAG: tyrosine-protein phosphatase [Desulfobacterales bacterium]|nr:tyrosine-protein phosphatase [Desulfobacterales bacterium]